MLDVFNKLWEANENSRNVLELKNLLSKLREAERRVDGPDDDCINWHECTKGRLPLLVDRGRLQLALEHVIDNAFHKDMPAQFSHHRSDGELKFAFTDMNLNTSFNELSVGKTISAPKRKNEADIHDNLSAAKPFMVHPDAESQSLDEEGITLSADILCQWHQQLHNRLMQLSRTIIQNDTKKSSALSSSLLSKLWGVFKRNSGSERLDALPAKNEMSVDIVSNAAHLTLPCKQYNFATGPIGSEPSERWQQLEIAYFSVHTGAAQEFVYRKFIPHQIQMETNSGETN